MVASVSCVRSICNRKVSRFHGYFAYEFRSESNQLAPSLKATIAKETLGVTPHKVRGTAQVDKNLFNDAHAQARFRAKEIHVAQQ
jgi:hypothetical protein